MLASRTVVSRVASCSQQDSWGAIGVVVAGTADAATAAGQKREYLEPLVPREVKSESTGGTGAEWPKRLVDAELRSYKY